MFTRIGKWIGPFLGLTLFLAALFVLKNELKDFNFDDVVGEIRVIGRTRVIVAGYLTILSYCVLVSYDYLGLRYAGKSLALTKVALASFISYSLSHTLGFALFTGGAARFRILSNAGVTAEQVAKTVAFVALMFGLGYSALVGVTLTIEPPNFIDSPTLVRTFGIVLVTVCIGFVLLCHFVRRPLSYRNHAIMNPGPRLATVAIVIGALDWVLAATVLYVLLPSQAIGFGTFLGIFLVSQGIALLSHVPGGVGIFEGMMMASLSPSTTPHALLGALLVYRVIYYGVPFILGLLTLGIYESRAQVKQITRFTLAVGRRSSHIVPAFLSSLVFMTGCLLLFSGATPAAPGRIEGVLAAVSLGVVEISYLMGSVVGVALLVISRGLWRRIDAAYSATLALLVAGIMACIVKGLDIEEASVLAFVTLILLPSRGAFYRKASLFLDHLSIRWVLMLIGVLSATVWCMFFFYKDTTYSNELWWQFMADSHASRSMRATFLATLVALFWTLSIAFAPRREPRSAPTDKDIEDVKRIVPKARDTVANLALLGDKNFLFNADRTGFVMYRRHGKCAIAMADPVTVDGDCEDLIWDFFEFAKYRGLYCVFYEASEANLPYYVDLGLQLLKLGEEAIVDLTTFSMEGRSRGSLRHTRNKMGKEGYRFEVLPAENVDIWIPALSKVSLEWLGEKSTREKSFSLGRFEPNYLRQFPLAVIWRGEEMIAFANVWFGDNGEELSIDLMRHRNDAPNGVMDYLFTEIMLWGKVNGYARFNLGMAPFSGFSDRPFSPLWAKLGKALFQRGENLYNFKGLRTYKEKFDPEWRSRYIACPTGFALPIVLSNVTTLISGGMRGVFAR